MDRLGRGQIDYGLTLSLAWALVQSHRREGKVALTSCILQLSSVKDSFGERERKESYVSVLKKSVSRQLYLILQPNFVASQNSGVESACW